MNEYHSKWYNQAEKVHIKESDNEKSSNLFKADTPIKSPSLNHQKIIPSGSNRFFDHILLIIC